VARLVANFLVTPFFFDERLTLTDAGRAALRALSRYRGMHAVPRLPAVHN